MVCVCEVSRETGETSVHAALQDEGELSTARHTRSITLTLTWLACRPLRDVGGSERAGLTSPIRPYWQLLVEASLPLTSMGKTH